MFQFRKLHVIASAAALVTLLAASAFAADLRAGTSMAATHPSAMVLKKLSELVKERSAGALNINVYTDGTLGNDGQMQQQVQSGTQDISTANAAGLAAQVKEMAVVEFPFLYRNSDEFYGVLGGEMGKELAAKLYEKGWVALGFSHNGFRHATNSKQPITKWEDFKGLKVRVIPNAMYIDMFSALGANPTPMPVSEVYAALETGTVDAQEAPLAQINAMRVYEVQKFISLTGHSVNSEIIVMSRKTYDAMTPENQQLIVAAGKDAVEWKRKQFAEMEAGLLKTIEEGGMTSNPVDNAELARMAEQMKPVIAKHSELAGKDFADRYIKAIEASRSGN
ncbi:DctP family TRAP transporter solute-binding subunit [Rhizobium sp. SSA_523]|uniref:DctP family TRAP transporter solute-binding subunit n=1 Tax=Rhizobium sp. SSA_523 TaxID=2952477 RepID=UPI0020901783|nr:DctP family TRAP transporter solute-binding subunit [Rhizobium sp. SSA_523]MCO5733364.1 DctP family TRAP transporter solute-binding subunit [Rhizobium sp. SSA_523]WKC21659.1 DctP family TRAP transporter solute-binding subunit [Rhizobium sp. SSA_523]